MMALINELRKYGALRLMEYFIVHPTQEIHLKELSREAGLSPRTVKIYCDLFEREGILISERKGNLRIFRLNNDDFAVKEIKRAYYILMLKDLGIEKVHEKGTLAIYGSVASGDLDERSDIDVIVIGKKKTLTMKSC